MLIDGIKNGILGLFVMGNKYLEILETFDSAL